MKELFLTIKNKLFGKSDDGIVQPGFASHEEFESRRTTRLGMIFVIIMVITGIWQGQVLFSAISASILPPENVSSCFRTLVTYSGENMSVPYDSSYQGSAYSYNDVLYKDSFGGYYGDTSSSNRCNFSELEIKHHIDELYASVRNDMSSLEAKEKELSEIDAKLYQARYVQPSYQNSYNTSLFETMANATSTVYEQESKRLALVEKERVISDLEKKKGVVQMEIQALRASIKDLILAKRTDLTGVITDMTQMLRWLELKRFVVALILLAPLAYFSIRKYFRVKNERSPFAIIWAGVALIGVILFSQLILVFVYRIIPHRIFEYLFTFFAELFAAFAFLRVVLQWLALILMPLFFGFIVYIIQKKYYNKEAVTMRAIKDGKCPQCSMKIKDTMTYCPMCSYTLRQTCTYCQKTSVCNAKFCEQCQKPFGV